MRPAQTLLALREESSTHGGLLSACARANGSVRAQVQRDRGTARYSRVPLDLHFSQQE